MSIARENEASKQVAGDTRNGKSCYRCKHRSKLPGDAHSRCGNREAYVTGLPQGIKNGWFNWPLNFDPAWVIACNGFEAKDGEQS